MEEHMSITFQQAFEKASAETKEVDPLLHDLLVVDVTARAYEIMEQNREPEKKFQPAQLTAAQELKINREIDCDVICSKIFGSTIAETEGQEKLNDLLFPELAAFKKKCAVAVTENPLTEMIRTAIEQAKGEFEEKSQDFSKRANARPGLPIMEMAKNIRAARVERDVENGVAYISEYGENNGPLIRTRIESA
jgi:hypothetical protein